MVLNFGLELNSQLNYSNLYAREIGIYVRLLTDCLLMFRK